MHAAPPPFAFPVFLVFFAALWVGVLWIIAHGGGWRALALKYPATAPPAGKKFYFVSANMAGGPLAAQYRSSLALYVSPQGIYLRPQLPFRLFHPPLFLPRDSMSDMKEGKFMIWRYTRFSLAGFDGHITVWGRAGRAIFSRPD